MVTLGTTSGCDEPTVTIDGLPIAVSTAGGPLMTGVAVEPFDQPVAALIDTLSPITVIDTLVPDPTADPTSPPPPPTRRSTPLELLADCPGDEVVGCDTVTRARFASTAVVDVHPCGNPTIACSVGIAPDGRAFDAVVGADVLSDVAVRLDLRDAAAPTLRLFPDIAGDDLAHCETGAAVIPVELSGGGTLIIEGGEVSYGATKLPLEVCLGPSPGAIEAPSGGDALLVLSTGLSVSVLSESAYQRYAAQVADAVPLAELDRKTLLLPSGATTARIAQLPSLAIVGSGAFQHGPCEEWRASVVMRTAGSCAGVADCPCSSGDQCQAAASVTLIPTLPVTFAIIPDEHALLQALRAELRPGQAEVDGLLGMNALSAVQLDLDYPGSRVIVVCTDGDARCTAQPRVGNPGAVTPAGKCVISS